MKKIILFLCLLPAIGFAELSWEKVSSGGPPGSTIKVVYRASVPHGWLVYFGAGDRMFTTSPDPVRQFVYVPDEHHEWQ